MAVNLIGRQCYISINHQDKYPLAFILCFTFSNYSADLLFSNKCALCLELESLYSINLCPRILSYFHLSTSIFSPFSHLHDKGMIPSLHIHARSLCIYLPGVQLLMLAVRPHTGLFCFRIAVCYC